MFNVQWVSLIAGPLVNIDACLPDPLGLVPSLVLVLTVASVVVVVYKLYIVPLGPGWSSR